MNIENKPLKGDTYYHDATKCLTVHDVMRRISEALETHGFDDDDDSYCCETYKVTLTVEKV